MNIEKKIKYIQLLDNLSEAFGESDDQSPEEIRQELRDEGFDIDATENRLLKFQQEISMAAKREVLDKAKIQRKKTLLLRDEIVNKIKKLSKDQILKFIWHPRR